MTPTLRIALPAALVVSALMVGGCASTAASDGAVKSDRQEASGNEKSTPPAAAAADGPVADAASAPKSGICKKDDVAAEVRRHTSAVRACYSKELAKDPKLSGQLKVSWLIRPDGKAHNVLGRSDNAVIAGPVAQCVVAVFTKMDFVKPEGGICKITWPFRFVPG